MAQMASITVFDGAATPVLHTLLGVSVSRNAKNELIAEYRENIASLPKEAQISCQMTYTTMKSGVVKCVARWVVPVMEAVTNANAAGYTAAPKVAFMDSFSNVSYAHPRSTVTSRRLCRMLAVNFANNVSTTVPAAVTGPASDLFDSLFMPN